MDFSDYQKARQGLLAADLSSQAKWKCIGSDRVRYLNGQTTCDVKRLDIAHSTLAAVTNTKGKIEGTLQIAATSTALLLDASPSLSESLHSRLSKYIISDDAELDEISMDWKLYHWIGDGSSRPDLPAESDHQLFFSTRYGLPGWDLWLPVHSPLSPPCASGEVWETIRVEQGIPSWGVDMNNTTLAPEMPLERLGALSYSKGCYIGQEVIARVKSIGHVNKQLCLLHSEKNVDLPLPQPCLAEGKPVGTATSSAPSPTRGGTCVLATVNRFHAEPGQYVEIGGTCFTILSP
jgi:tRNA-modifying protein YgfZ